MFTAAVFVDFAVSAGLPSSESLSELLLSTGFFVVDVDG